MTDTVSRRTALGMLAATAAGAAAPFGPARAQRASPLEITIAGGQFRPIPLAVPTLFGDDARAQAQASEITEVATANLVNSGLFRLVPREAHVQSLESMDQPPRFADWRAIGAEALLVGRAAFEPDGRLSLAFRLFDAAAESQLEGKRYFVDPAAWRRAAHKLSDAVYTALTGESGYFDSRIVFVDESGGKGDRVKRLGLMDQDGANPRYLTDGRHIVLTPRFSPVDQELLYISYETGQPQVFMINLDSGQREALGGFGAQMSFAPRFSPDGRQVALSLVEGGVTDVFLMDLATRRMRRLTSGPAIDTAPSFAPDGSRIVFESDRGGGSQIYLMGAQGGSAERISFGQGRYGTPVWSPRGDLIAFTRQAGGRFEIGVMRPDGSGERILDSSYHSEGPSWSPNGRVLAFFRETPGQGGGASLFSVDVAGLNLRRLPTPRAASDPAWSPLLP
ncbi:MAG: Tol-Pal system beta propeller repeat protein TolB [Rubrimonas sp.]|uniref:Tol-Pal system beta propeller repeat protein TolB n=1 Tax=Rubrimonas sp. TaxID=2036015 RepID=UPI002FDF08F4